MIELLLIGVVLLVAMSKQFNGGGQFGNSFTVLRARLATSYIEFKTAIGVGLGGVKRVDRTGITTVNDAGAAGAPSIAYNPTTDMMYYGYAGLPARAFIVGSGLLSMSAGITSIYAYINDNLTITVSGVPGVVTFTPSGQINTGWLLAKGVGGAGSEFHDTDWSAVEAAGSKWRIQTVTAPARQAGRGGIWRFGTATVTPCVLDGWSNSYSAQDGYRIYARFAIQSDAADFYGVGVCDAPAAVAPNSIPYVNDASLIVHIAGLGVNFFHRTVVAAGAVSVDTGVPAVVGEYVRVDMIARTDRTIQLWINGTLVTTSVAAQSPLAATLLRKVLHANNSGAAVAAYLDIDDYDIVESRNTAVTP